MRRLSLVLRLHRPPLALALAMAAAVALSPSPSNGEQVDDSPQTENAADLKKNGDTAFLAGQYSQALALYERAYKLGADPALLYNMGRCHQELGNHPQAHDYFTRFAVEAPPEMRAKVPLLKDKIAALAAKIATVKIAVNVVGATVTVDGKSVGASGSLEPLRFNAGKLEIAATKDGYFPARKAVDAPGGRTTSVELTLLEKQTFGVLRLTTSVPGTAVGVDGKIVGNPPLEVTVPAGAHSVSASRKGYEPYSSTVVVPAGGTRDHEIRLVATPGILSRWWFWTGVGAVVVTGTVLGYSLLTERSPGHGSFNPGQISAGIVHF